MREISLSRGKFAIVDDEDYEGLNQHKWYALKACRTWYAARRAGTDFVYMHAVLAQTPKGAKTDHVDGDGLNNRRGNLRICTDAQNACNQTRKRRGEHTSRYRGVHWDKVNCKWLVNITGAGFKKNLGRYSCEFYAAGVYDAAGIARDPKHFTPNFSASWLAPVQK
jgi:hypothetical protein